MQLIGSLARIVNSERVLPDAEKLAAEDSPIPILRACADLYWRREEWSRAADIAKRVLAKKPADFHALAIVVSCLGHMGDVEAAYPYARRLIRAKRPNWTSVKLVCVILGASNLLIPGRRNRVYGMLERCKVEAEADDRIVAYARQLIADREAGNDAVAA